MADGAALDPLYVAAEHVLLDALIVLAPHDNAVIVVGAQAIYLRTAARATLASPSPRTPQMAT